MEKRFQRTESYFEVFTERINGEYQHEVFPERNEVINRFGIQELYSAIRRNVQRIEQDSSRSFAQTKVRIESMVG